MTIPRAPAMPGVGVGGARPARIDPQAPGPDDGRTRAGKAPSAKGGAMPAVTAASADRSGAGPSPAGDEALVRGFDLRRVGADFLENPYPTYRALRRLSPVHRCPDGSLFLTR